MSVFVESKRNGLKIAIHNEARNVVYRYATRGDNEVIFVPIRKSSFKRGRASEVDPVHMDDKKLSQEYNIIDDEDIEDESKAPTKAAKKSTAAAKRPATRSAAKTAAKTAEAKTEDVSEDLDI